MYSLKTDSWASYCKLNVDNTLVEVFEVLSKYQGLMIYFL